MDLTLNTCCPVCKTTENLSRCQACQVVSYCGREHQAANRDAHKKACNAVKKSKRAMEIEERNLRDLDGDMFTPENVFEEAVGQFWGILETRPYMRAVFAHMDALKMNDTRLAIQTACSYAWEMLRLCRSDNMGIRDVIPSLLLRLGKDQDCYDFMKWHAIDRDNYDWGDMSLPYLDVKDADILEDVTLFVAEYGDLCHTVALTLIKIRLYLELQNIQNSWPIGQKVPEEILRLIQNQLTSDAMAKHPRRQEMLQKREVLDSTVSELRKQIVKLYHGADKANKHFWPAMMNPASALRAPISAYSSGSVEEMILYLRYSYKAWEETPGAIQVIDLLQDDRFMDEDELNEILATQ